MYFELPYPVWQLCRFKKILLALKWFFIKEVLWILYIFVRLWNCSLEVAVFVLLCHESAAEFSAKKLSSKTLPILLDLSEETPLCCVKGPRFSTVSAKREVTE